LEIASFSGGNFFGRPCVAIRAFVALRDAFRRVAETAFRFEGSFWVLGAAAAVGNPRGLERADAPLGDGDDEVSSTELDQSRDDVARLLAEYRLRRRGANLELVGLRWQRVSLPGRLVDRPGSPPGLVGAPGPEHRPPGMNKSGSLRRRKSAELT